MPFDPPSVRNLPVVQDTPDARLTAMLDDVRVAAPCPASWDDMVGTEQVRHCGQCSKNVYNFSEMTRPEIADLLMNSEGRVCGRLYRRKDGTMLTADCPVGLAEKAYKMARRSLLAGITFVGFLVAAVIGLFSPSKCQAIKGVTNVITQSIDEEMTMGRMAPPDDMVMGDVAYEPPAK